ncbi:S-layer homology domain-containing protein [Cohnella fermenti]|uniref:Uncharacterized protein n=1 Tax=Cohnella fermenti TaxID=2565925 RepID=A0A4S4BMY0_9BACL|nr:S-layer homology domain-containing protein [Cohnella fermenti]THF76219.1 hypothetical protein E6C55_19525 [Cohnella fermenti]
MIYHHRKIAIMLCMLLMAQGLLSGRLPEANASEEVSSTAEVVSVIAATYYVSQSTGEDSYDGLAPEWDGTHGPWKTLEKVSDQTYSEGDTIRLKSGDAWNEQVTLRGSGTAEAPITLTSYGAGNRPYLYRDNGIDDEVIRIDNGDGYVVQGLEIANARRGIRIIADGNTKPRFEHYRIQDNYFHNIQNLYGSSPGDEGTAIDLVTVPGDKPVFADIQIRNNIFRQTEIGYIMWSDGSAPRQEDVLIEGSTFMENGRNQVFQWSGQNVDVINNLFYYNYPTKYFGVGLTSVLTESLSGEEGVYNEVDGNEFGWAGTYPGDHDGTGYDFEKSGDYIHFTNNFIHDSYRYGVMFMGGQVFHDLVFDNNIFQGNTLGTKDSPFNVWLRGDNSGSGQFSGNQFYSDDGVTGFYQKPAGFTYANNTDPAAEPGFAAMPMVTQVVTGPAERTYTFASATWGAELRYTLDGSVPVADSPLYTGPIAVSGQSTVVNVKAFMTGLHPSKTNSIMVDLRESAEGDGPAHWWKLDETTGDLAEDSVGGADGSLTNGVWTAGAVDGALEFNGIGSAVDVNDASLVDIASNFTMSFWVKPRSEITLQPEAGNGITGDSGQRYAIAPAYRGGGANSTDAGAGVSIGTNGISVVEHSDMYLPAVLVDDGVTFDPEKWTHVAVVYKKNQPWLYINGVFRKAGYTSAKTVHPSADIGGSGLGRFDGLVDDVRIYDRPLGIQELQQMSVQAHETEIPAFAAQWDLLNAPGSGTEHPTGVAMDDNAIVFSGDGYYTITEGEVAGINGAVLKRPIDAAGFNVDFTVQQISGDLAAEDDSWVSFSVLDSPQFFNVVKPEQAQGIVVLMRQWNGKLNVEPYKLTDAGFQSQGATTLDTSALNHAYELSLEESGGIWTLMIDDTALNGDYGDLIGTVLAGQAYAAVGLSDKNGGWNRVAIRAVNGEQAYGLLQAPTWQDGFLNVGNVGADQATLSWGGATDSSGITGYRIYRDGVEIAQVDGSSSSYIATGLAPATSYTFKVEAGNGKGQWSGRGPGAHVTTDYEVPDDMSFADDWQLYTGQQGGQALPTEARLGSNGIVFMGSGYYTVAGGEVVPANGAVFKQPVDADQWFVRFTPEQLSGSLSANEDSWLAISLMSTVNYFDVLDSSKGQGIVVLLRDTGGKLTVQPHKLTAASGFAAMPEITLDAQTLQQHELRLVNDGGLWRLSVDNVLLDGDYSDMVNDTLGSNAYVQIGLSDKLNKQNRIRIHTVNGYAAYLPDQTERAMSPFWQGDTMYDESLLMVSADGAMPEASLLFEPTDILSVRSARLDKTFVEGEDWEYSEGKLRLLPGSSIPYMTEAELYPVQPAPNESVDKRGGGAVLLKEGSFFHDRQIVVTYKHAEGEWEGPTPSPATEALPRTLAKLDAGQPLKLLVLGDSIGTGANASGIINAPPYLADWATLLQRTLESRYGADITLINYSQPGTTTLWGIEEAEIAAAEQPDTVILEFGGNDGVGSDELYSPPLFRANMETMMSLFREENPNVEFILVGPSLANPETYFDGKQRLYPAELEQLAEEQEGAAAVDMIAVHEELLRHKAFRDMTGNNVNHPNDFLVRWYAQMLAGTLISSSDDANEPGGEGTPTNPNQNPNPQPGDSSATEGAATSAVQEASREQIAQWVREASHSSYVKLTPAGQAVDVQIALSEGLPVGMELTLSVDSFANPDWIGIYRWDQEQSEWIYVGGTLDASGRLSATIDRSGVYAVLAYERLFSDVPSGHWAEGAIKRLAAAHIVEGISEARFEPNRQVTRGEFAALLARALQLTADGASPFIDVPEEEWYAQAVAASFEAGIVRGISPDSFGPDSPISREEMAVMLMRAYDRNRKPIIAQDSGTLSYSDKEDVSVWARADIARATEKGFMQGVGQSRFAPELGASRAQAVVALSRLLSSIRSSQ